MSCERASQIEPADYLAEPLDERWAGFRAHYPTCEDCSRVVAGWTHLETQLEGMARAADGAVHAEPALLLAFVDGPGDLEPAQRAAIEGHLGDCAVCRDTVSGLRRFAGVEAAAESAPATPAAIRDRRSSLERLAARLGDWLALPGLRPALTVALLALVLLAIGRTLFDDGASEAPPALVDRQADPGDPDAPPSPLESDPAMGAPEPGEREGGMIAESEPGPAESEPSGAVPPAPGSAHDAPVEPLLAESEPGAKPGPSEGWNDEPPFPPTEGDLEGPSETVLLAALDPAFLPDAFPSYRSPWPADAASGRSRIVVRGAPGEVGPPRIEALAPHAPGRSASPGPSLSFFLPEPVAHPVEVVVAQRREPDPLYETRLTPPVAAGIHRVSLEEAGVRLPAGVDLYWSVSILRDAERPDRNPSVRVDLRHEPPPESLTEALARARPEAAANLYAEAGYWYDAIAALSAVAEAHPEAPEPRARRAALLEAEGLDAVARWDRAGVHEREAPDAERNAE